MGDSRVGDPVIRDSNSGVSWVHNELKCGNLEGDEKQKKAMQMNTMV